MHTGAAGQLTHLESVPVGLEPVAVGVRSPNEVWVVNHLSDSISIINVRPDNDNGPSRVVRTLLVGDEPSDVVFAGPAETEPSSPQHTGARTSPSTLSSPLRAWVVPTCGCTTRTSSQIPSMAGR